MHNFKKIWKPLLVLAVCAVLLKGVDYLLYPCTFTRYDVHAVTTKQYDDIIVGTSHGKMNIDPAVMEKTTGRTGHNMCVGGEYGVDAYHLVRLIAEKQNPKRIIYEVDPAYFASEKEEGNNYLLFYHEFPLSKAKWDYFWASIAKCNFRTILFPWYEYDLGYELEKIGDTASKKSDSSYDISWLKSDAQEYEASGFINRYPVNTKNLEMIGLKLYEREKLSDKNMEYLEKTIDFCKEKGIEFVAVSTPVPQDTLKAYTDNYISAWKDFEAFFAEKEVPYLNFNGEFYKAFTHNITAFTDYDGHMHGKAARDFSEVFAKVLVDTVDTE